MTEQSSKFGTVFLVGAGPGDPELITVKGLEKIKSADVIVYDYLASPELLAEARPDAELVYVGKKGSDHTLEQMDINSLLVDKASKNKVVVRLKGGDPYVFGRGGEEAEELGASGVPFEVVPGISSAVAAPAYAGIPVTHRDHASMVIFVTGHENPEKEESALDWEFLARNPGTSVFLMGVKNLPNITRSLMEYGKSPDTPAALVRWGTTPRQVSVVSTLADIADAAKRKNLAPPAVLIVGSVVNLHDTLGWFEQKPLFGKRVLITRGRSQSGRMADQISKCGAEPVLFPTIEILPPEDSSPLDEALTHISVYDWIIFTSVNGVEKFFERFFQINEDIRMLAGPRLGAIGPVTAASIKKFGLKVDLLAKEFIAEGVLDLLTEEQIANKRFLIPRAAKARDILPKGITDLGGLVDVVAVYRTGKPTTADVAKITRELEQKRIDAVTFTSSSTVTHFAEMLNSEDVKGLLQGVTLASIGPITSQTMRSLGLRVDVEAQEYTIDGLVKALADHFSKK